MAVRDVAGRRYALAAMDIARADGSFDSWARAIDGLNSLTQRPEFVAALQADGMTDEKFVAVVRQVVPEIRPIELNLLRLLRSKSRLALGPSIASYFADLLDEERGIVRARLRTAVPLDDAQVAGVRQRLAAQTGRTVELEAEVDPAIIGGAILQVGDQLIDGSTRRRLQRLRAELSAAG
ncbi:MAG: ATP synthase F1 subunit delta [Dehalococcoidia bacterium]